MPKHTFARMPLPARTAITVCAALLFALLCCLVFTWIAMASEDPTAHLGLYGEIVFALTMLLCGFLGAKFGGENRFANGLLSVGIVLIFVIAASIVFGGTSFVKEVLLALLGCFMGAGGSLFGAKETKRRRKH